MLTVSPRLSPSTEFMGLWVWVQGGLHCKEPCSVPEGGDPRWQSPSGHQCDHSSPRLPLCSLHGSCSFLPAPLTMLGPAHSEIPPLLRASSKVGGLGCDHVGPCELLPFPPQPLCSRSQQGCGSITSLCNPRGHRLAVLEAPAQH